MLDGRWSGLGTVLTVDAVQLFAFPVAQHDTHGQGPPNFFKIDRNFNAGPSFMLSECIKWSSVSSGSPEPSIHCSRKFWNETWKKHRTEDVLIEWLQSDLYNKATASFEIVWIMWKNWIFFLNEIVLSLKPWMWMVENSYKYTNWYVVYK